MNRTSAALAGSCLYRARALASLALCLAVIPLVPVPALLVALGRHGFDAALAILPRLLRDIAAAFPGFALPAFVFGCMIGAAMHLQLTSTEWLGDTAALQTRRVGMWPAAVSASLVGMLLASLALAFSVVAPTLR